MEGEVCVLIFAPTIKVQSVCSGNTCWSLTKMWLYRMFLLESVQRKSNRRPFAFQATGQECSWNCKPLDGEMGHIKCNFNQIHLNIFWVFIRHGITVGGKNPTTFLLKQFKSSVKIDVNFIQPWQNITFHSTDFFFSE